MVVENGKKVGEGEIVYEFKQGKILRLPLTGWRNLGVKIQEEIIKKISGKKLVKNELLWKGGWFDRRELRSPEKGKCLRIDELGNILLSDGSAEIYRSPIFCPKIRVEKDRVIFELRGWEKAAKGISEIKGWGEFGGVWVKNLSEMPAEIQNQVVVAEGDEAIVAKAEALGAKGIILVETEVGADFKDAGIPIVTMERDEVEDMIKLSKESAKSRVWINPVSGKVLLVLE